MGKRLGKKKGKAGQWGGSGDAMRGTMQNCGTRCQKLWSTTLVGGWLESTTRCTLSSAICFGCMPAACTVIAAPCSHAINIGRPMEMVSISDCQCKSCWLHYLLELDKLE